MPAAILAPFQNRSFRFQWPADLLASSAFEMEALILSWYVLVETHSVLMLTAFSSLQYVGTLFAPLFGVAGDRIGHRNLLCLMRAIYVALAATLLAFAVTGTLTPVRVFVISALLGLVRPSDLAVRATLVGESVPGRLLTRAMGIARTTADAARILGALSGAALVAGLGMAPAYVMIVALYAVSLTLTLQVGRGSRGRRAAAERAMAQPGSPWADLRDGFGHVWSTPHLLAVMCLACLVNLTAFPLMNQLMPYVAKEVYGLDQRGLGFLIAGTAFGQFLGSLAAGRMGGTLRLARMIVVATLIWHVMLVVFSQMLNPVAGFLMLMLAGFFTSLSMVPMATVLIRNTDTRYRGRVMGIRMFAIYALPIGLLCSGPLITRIGYPGTAALYCATGILFTLLITYRWRRHLWWMGAPANAR